jgi:hypothetical protein
MILRVSGGLDKTQVRPVSDKVIKFDMIYILLTAVGLTPGGSSTVHICTQTVHRTTQLNRVHRTEHT